jgi:glutathione S-transferase
MIKVWGRIDSSNVAKVLWALDELGLKYSHLEWGGRFGGNDDPAYRALNPHGKVPTLLDGDVAIWESNVIVRYLGARYGGALWPTDAKSRAALEQWMDWTSITLSPELIQLRGRLKTASAVDAPAAIAAFAPQMTIVETWLTKRAYIGGDDFTFGDIPLGPVVHRWFLLPVTASAFPALDAYRQRLEKHPGYRAHVATLS